jgi:hypothetical protein
MGACWVAARLIPSSCSLVRFAELDEYQAGNYRLGKRAISFVIAQPTSPLSRYSKHHAKRGQAMRNYHNLYDY